MDTQYLSPLSQKHWSDGFYSLWYHLMLTQGKNFHKLTQYVLLAAVGPDPTSCVPAAAVCCTLSAMRGSVSMLLQTAGGVSLERPMHLCKIAMGKYLLFWKYLFFNWSIVSQLCPTLCDPMDCSLPGSSLHGILQARVLEWGAIAPPLYEYRYII